MEKSLPETSENLFTKVKESLRRATGHYALASESPSKQHTPEQLRAIRDEAGPQSDELFKQINKKMGLLVTFEEINE